MAELIFEIFARVTGVVIGSMINTGVKKSKKKTSNPSTSTKPKSPPVILSASQTEFGNICEQLVNFAFETSQTSPKAMKTCTQVTHYIQNELRQKYPKEKFYVIIGESDGFGYAVTDAQYFAEISQEPYRVLIFNTRRGVQMKFDTHDANSQMPLLWQ